MAFRQDTSAQKAHREELKPQEPLVQAVTTFPSQSDIPVHRLLAAIREHLQEKRGIIATYHPTLLNAAEQESPVWRN